MVYIDSEFYTETFKGREIPASDFDRLAEAASEAIYAVCRMKPDETMILNEDFKKAVCYETELLYERDYSVAAGSSQKGVATLSGGIPVSPVALQILKRLGLMSRWAYSGFFDPWR